MPYKTIASLPDSLQNVLPHHAQEIYLAAFNSSYNNYKDPHKRATNESREETAHKVAWAAVKKEDMKVGETWKSR